MRAVLSIVLFLSCMLPLAAQPADEARRYAMAQALEKSGDLRGAAAIYLELHTADTLSDTYFEAVRRTYSALGWSGQLLPLVERRLNSHKGDQDLRVLY